MVGGEALRDLVLVRVAALEQAHRADRGQDPTQLADLGDIGLAEDDGLGGVKPQREEIRRDLQRLLPQQRALMDGG